MKLKKRNISSLYPQGFSTSFSSLSEILRSKLSNSHPGAWGISAGLSLVHRIKSTHMAMRCISRMPNLVTLSESPGACSWCSSSSLLIDVVRIRTEFPRRNASSS